MDLDRCLLEWTWIGVFLFIRYFFLDSIVCLIDRFWFVVFFISIFFLRFLVFLLFYYFLVYNANSINLFLDRFVIFNFLRFPLVFLLFLLRLYSRRIFYNTHHYEDKSSNSTTVHFSCRSESSNNSL